MKPIMGSFWQQTFVNPFTTGCQEMKESVHCGGEEKKAAHLEVKLEILGRLGRQISASYCPEN